MWVRIPPSLFTIGDLMHNYYDEENQPEEEGESNDCTHTMMQITCNEPHPIDVSLAVVDIFVKAGCIGNMAMMTSNEFILYGEAIGALTDMIKRGRQLESDSKDSGEA